MMNRKQVQTWLSLVDHSSTAQGREAEAVLSEGSQASTSLAAVEAGVGEDRRCPHYGAPGAVSRGKARGLRRYQCKGCGKTFNAATGTPLAGLHRKERWLAFGTCLADGETVRASAVRCGLAVNTAFRWRHRFLAAGSRDPRMLAGIVEADALRDVIEPVVDEDIVLVSDGHRAYPPCAAAMGVRHEALNLSGDERVRNAFHIQTVKSRHGQLKGVPGRSRGIAAKYLDNYLRWFQQVELGTASPRTCLANPIDRSCKRLGSRA